MAVGEEDVAHNIYQLHYRRIIKKLQSKTIHKENIIMQLPLFTIQQPAKQ